MKTRHAFTLVEILTVVAIIGILATIITVAVAAAMSAAKRAKIAVEMSHITMGIERYKAEFDEYPPDLFDDESLVRHVRKRWPRLEWSNMPSAGSQAESIRIAINEAYGNNVNFGGIAPLLNSQAGSLAHWLGGFPNSDGTFLGFYADPENPFTPSDTFDKKTFANLELGKNVRLENYGNGCIVPVVGTEVQSNFVPFVYFRGTSSGGHTSYMITDAGHTKYGQIKQFDFSSANLGFCVPYAEDANGGEIKWKHPSTFQLIHPGLDGNFGEPAPDDPTVAPLRVIKTGENVGALDLDNITNFSDNKELKSILP